MATSATNWKPVSRRTTILPDGSTLKRTRTDRDFHSYKLETPDKKVRDIFLVTPMSSRRPVHKSLLTELRVTTPDLWGSPRDFHSIGHDVVRNVLKTFQKMYPKMKGIYGGRMHKPKVSQPKVSRLNRLDEWESEYPTTLFKFKNIKDR